MKTLAHLLTTFLFLVPSSFAATGATSGTGATSAKPPTAETATLAGGCFWGMEEVFRKAPGVIETRVGYTGGTVENPSYEQVSSGNTGHAESIEIRFDPARLSYEQLLLLFFKMHDPTTPNRQGNDVGSQYRSAIFYHGAQQRKTAERVEAKVNQSHKWGKDVATQLVPAGKFFPAESYHQKYLVKNPDGYNDHFVRNMSFD
jgi:methionine-S-sulfoxide reductase